MRLFGVAFVCLLAASFLRADVLKDVLYLEGEELAQTDEVRRGACRLDVSWPHTATGLPVLVWFHGGGLTKGEKSFMRPIRDPGRIVHVAVGYRLLGKPGVSCESAPIEDAAAAVAWTFRHISELGGDPHKVFLSGSSAGGYLTMMVGMDPKWLARYGLKISDLAGLAPNSGQATTHFAIKRFRKDSRTDLIPVIDEYAPLYHVTNWKDIPPIVCITGEPPWEWVGRAEENELMIATLKGLGHPRAWYVRLPYANHARTTYFGPSYVEQFVHGNYPDDLCLVQHER